ncbi:diphthine synthase [Halocaridina rubra]|uniref:diphthine methyl ester synthase n=1 Tax=Halocaridina rubra TaxID=373956 RepID=A0AAN9A992_HALRR
MVFYLIGLGLGDPSDVTVRGLEVIKKCSRVYLEAYTSIISTGKSGLESLYGREVIIADREQVEQGSDDLFAGADTEDVALLVVGDPFGATTHTDLKLRAHQLGMSVEVISNASILNAVGCCGLQLYHFGETVSIPFWQDGWEPDSFCEKINRNLKKKLHTLCLLDIKVKEQSLENLMKGRKIYEPPRYMRVHQAAQQLLSVVKKRSSNPVDCEENEDLGEEWLLKEDTQCVAVVRVGTANQHIAFGSLEEMASSDYGDPLHSLIVCGDCHPMEKEALEKLSRYYNGCKRGPDSDNGSRGTFHFIGLGLGQPEDVTVKGREFIKKSSLVYLEGYTSIMMGGAEAVENMIGKKVSVAEREMVESGSQEMFEHTINSDVAFLVVGDPFGATTHIDLAVRALNENIPINIVHNASILNAVGCCGLQLYSFGETVSIPFWQGDWKPDSYYDKICSNLDSGWHTLCLLDIKVKEQSVENMMKGRKIYEPPRYMTVAQAASQLLQIIDMKDTQGISTPLTKNHLVVGLARIGTSTQSLKACSLEDMSKVDMGEPLHSLVIVGATHPMEEEYIDMYKL